MPHLFVNRPRDLATEAPESRSKALAWTYVTETIYVVGSILFVVGSVFFFPGMAKDVKLGIAICLIGSLMFVVVSTRDLIESSRLGRKLTARERNLNLVERGAALSYWTGGMLHLAGDVASLYDLEHLLVYGAWLSVIGSLLFLAGATLNVIDVANAPQGRIMQLTNLTAVAFVVGAVLFTVGSFPDFWHEAVHNDREEMLTYVAWLSVWGSAVFLLGGLINYRRALLVQEMRGGA